MWNWARHVAALAFVVADSVGAAAQPVSSAVAVTPGGWGFDVIGADFTKPPGDDFFRYCNGLWLDHATIPSDRSSIGVSIALRITTEARIREILEHGEQGVEPAPREDAAKITSFYAAYMNEHRAEELDGRPVAPFIRMIRAAATREELVDLMGAANGSFFGSVFNLQISPDDRAPDRYVVSIRQGGLGLNRDYYIKRTLAKKKAAYLHYITQILEMIGWNSPARSAAEILAFESTIAKVSWTEAQRRDPEKTYHPMSVATLGNMARFPWPRLLASAGLSNLDQLIVAEDTAISKIATIYVRTPIHTLKSWQAFHVIDETAPYLSKRFTETEFSFRAKAMNGVAEQPERWKRAVSAVEDAMAEAIGRVYVARYFSLEAKAQIDDLVAQLRIALKKRIDQLDWMSEETKLTALNKLARFQAKIAYPTKWRDYSALEMRRDDLVGDVQAARKFNWQRQVNRLNSPVDRDEWDMSPQTVNASYDANLNEILLPAGILQPPYFDPMADPAVNYGGIGTIISHEMIHGFDDEGRKYDSAGVLSNWWTKAEARQFDERAAVLGRQFDAYQPFPGIHVKGNLTMGENIADLAGVLVALDAYHLSVGNKSAPAIDSLSGDQRFFLSYAQSWREKSTEESIRHQLVSDSHAPVEYRVNGVVRNIDAWYAAFNVKPGDKLFLEPKHRAQIW
jgi:putative endopeptidase